MRKYECEVCGYVYDPEIGDPDNGIAAGTPFEDLPEDWVCPLGVILGRPKIWNWRFCVVPLPVIKSGSS